jgi:hypothetical protein
LGLAIIGPLFAIKAILTALIEKAKRLVYFEFRGAPQFRRSAADRESKGRCRFEAICGIAATAADSVPIWVSASASKYFSVKMSSIFSYSGISSSRN